MRFHAFGILAVLSAIIFTASFIPVTAALMGENYGLIRAASMPIYAFAMWRMHALKLRRRHG